MEQSILILGRQPAIGLAELESLYGADSLHPVAAAPRDASPRSVILDRSPQQVTFGRLGGSSKLAGLLGRLDTTDWNRLEQQLRTVLPGHLTDIPEGKLKIGLSAYGFDISTARLNATGLTIKKIVRSAQPDRSVRIIPNKELQLNSAQVLHNGLTTPTGVELLLIRDGTTTLLARTIHEQDIDAYAARDQGRPKRDARVGMLPPKLAQTIINLAAAGTAPVHASVLDPFCGTGVVLQEALLMGFDVYGSDVEPRMIDFSAKNLDWLTGNHTLTGQSSRLETGDATNHSWQPAPSLVAGEGYLGQPFSTAPSAQKLAEVRSTCNLILKKFLQNIGRQLPSGTRLCLGVPAWQLRPGQFQHLPLLSGTPEDTIDHLADMGYNRVSFKHVETGDLIYARADQIVARELLVLTKL